jgi:hypothetical protein
MLLSFSFKLIGYFKSTNREKYPEVSPDALPTSVHKPTPFALPGCPDSQCLCCDEKELEDRLSCTGMLACWSRC